ncbi:hypothetical protein ASE00_06505 [Sphingomonas sp. Root710]|nr:hypothetical protein ASE00_06505 [Sphingomonas sp. Root710]
MDAPIGPAGYPPPTLIRKRSGSRRKRAIILLFTVGTLLVIYAVSQLLAGDSAQNNSGRPVPPVAVEGAGPRDADANPATMPDSAAEPPMTVETPGDGAAPAQPSPDAREANHWYYVAALGDGPGVIYSRTGGRWNFAFACTLRTRTIEFIAVGTGAPGSFDKQSISVGKVRLMMDASYSPDGGGTITTTLPAAHPFFSALSGAEAMEVRLYETRKTVVPIGADVARLVKTCRRGG